MRDKNILDKLDMLEILDILDLPDKLNILETR